MNVNEFVSYGNRKLPASTCILNAGAATDCPSVKLGLCQAGASCYALKAERMYPAVLPYRRRQANLYTQYGPREFAAELLAAFKRRKVKVKAFRFNEAGDFADQQQLDWFAVLCQQLQHYGVRCYGYTARTDLDLNPLLAVASVNVSNDRGDWIARGANRFRMVAEPSGEAYVCPGNCRRCNMCQRVDGFTIEIVKH